MKFPILKYKDYHADRKLIDGIKEVIAPSYKNAGAHIFHDIEICNELYVINTDEEKMLAFFMVGYHTINDIKCCYLGLSACREEYKSSGFVKTLYLEFVSDCMKREMNLSSKIVCYATTATPIVYSTFPKLFSKVQPDVNGNCSVEAKQILLEIAQQKYAEADFELDTPFVLRHAAKEINYSDKEKERIRKAINDLNLSVFDRYKIDESNGDRFLMIGYTPF